MRFLSEKESINGPSAVTVGMFDGLHLGHKALIARLKESAKDLKTLIFTFRLSDEARSIYTADEKKTLLRGTGVDYACLQPFTTAFSNTDREEFIRLMKDRYNMKALAAGEDFHFGKGAMGDADFLVRSAGRLGIDVTIVPPVILDDDKVSSTRIRGLISAGDVKEAGRLLGGQYFATGAVRKGNRIGTGMGFPTINIETPKLKPKNGVYATWTRIGNEIYGSVTNVGVRPTVSDRGAVNIETNIFDFDCEIYDEEVAVYFEERIRDEKKFESPEALKSQIVRDTESAKRLLGNKSIYKPE